MHVANDVDDAMFWYLCTTDKGANEAFARKMMTVSLQDCSNVLFVDLDCFEHASHLITLAGLKQMDSLLKPCGVSFKYFSACAIVTNVMRDCAKDIYLEWSIAYGPKSANECVKKLMPRCNSGRWGSIHETEERFLRMGPQLATILNTVLAKKAASKAASKPVLVNDLNPDTLAVEQAAAFTATMGKWRRYALETVQDILWHRCLAIMHRARNPIMHFTHFVRSKPSQSQLDSKGNQVCQLVNGKMYDILAEFYDLLDESQSI